MSCLNLWQVTLVGRSLGGFISWKTMVFDERRIANTFLINPEGISNAYPLTLETLGQWRKNPKQIEQYLAKLFTDKPTIAYTFLSKVLLHFEMDFSPTLMITKDEAQKIKTPVNIIVAEKDDFFPSTTILENAKAIFPTLNQTLLLKNARHFPSARGRQLIAGFVRKAQI